MSVVLLSMSSSNFFSFSYSKCCSFWIFDSSYSMIGSCRKNYLNMGATA